MPEGVRTCLETMLDDWIGNSQGWAGMALNGALTTMKITSQEYAGHSQGAIATGMVSGGGLKIDCSDPDKPIKISGSTGPAMSEVVLHQMAMTQAAFKKLGITTLDITRNVQNKYGSKGIVDQMKEDGQKKAASGGGAQLIANPLSSWSQRNTDTFGGFQMRKQTPVHLVFMHHRQKHGNKKLFGSYTEKELEVIAISQKCSALQPITSDQGKYKFAALDLDDAVSPDATLPEGFGKYVYRGESLWWWVTNSSVVPVYYVG
jgi:hypothetical protein